jgi:hypothetical protein
MQSFAIKRLLFRRRDRQAGKPPSDSMPFHARAGSTVRRIAP